VLNSEGAAQRVIPLVPPVDAARIALDDQGNVFVLGIDPDFFYNRASSCLLVHKYSSDGHRSVSFSEAPQAWNLRGRGNGHPGPDIGRLRTETDRGHLWVSDGLVCHLLPLSRTLRVFDSSGMLVREIRLQSPDTRSDRDLIWNLFPISDQHLLVDWVHEEPAEHGLTRGRHLCVHDSNGAPISALASWREVPGPPIGCDRSGVCVLVARPTPGVRELINVSVRLR